MKLRVGNGCWHAGHVRAAAICSETGFFAQEGLDVEVVHAKINPAGFQSSRPDGERYDEIGTVLRDMIAFNIDIIPDVHVRTPFAERALGNDELRIIGGWRNQFRGTLIGAPDIKSVGDFKGKRVGDWYKEGYKIKRGVLGITADIEVVVGAEPKLEEVFQARKRSTPWNTPVRDTYERYLKLFHDEVQYLGRVDHVVHDSREDWEWCPQGKLKWFVHPDIETGGRQVWAYLQEIPPRSRSGKHLHVAEEQLLVIEGNGYDIHDGERWNWQAGEFICIPRMTTHQHFNSGDSRACCYARCRAPSSMSVSAESSTSKTRRNSPRVNDRKIKCN